MTSVPMDNMDSPVSSDSAHTPLQDEHIIVLVTSPDKPQNNGDANDLTVMAEEQLDYEDFLENPEDGIINSESEDGECDSDDNVESKAHAVDLPIHDSGIASNNDIRVDTETISDMNEPLASGELQNVMDSENVDTKEELAEGELKAEEEEPPAPETPWERGLRLARERRELAKQKKVQEKDKLKERQLNLNLDGVEEVEPITKPITTEVKELNPKLLKALQPIIILAEEPRGDEMTLEYYMAENDYQHRPRFIPSKLYTLDPWEVEEWKRELDMIKFENEMMASNKMKRSGKRQFRRSSGSSYVSSRSSSPVAGRALAKMSDRNYEAHTSQYALNRQRSSKKSTQGAPVNAVAGIPTGTDNARGRPRKRDLPPEFQHRVPSSSGSSSRSSSGSQSSSSSSSSSSSNSSRSSRHSPVARQQRPHPHPQKVHTQQRPHHPLQGAKKPALGRARSNSSASSASSGSSSSSSGNSSSSGKSSQSSRGSRKRSTRKGAGDKQFIDSWVGKTRPSAPLATTVVPETRTMPNQGAHETERNNIVNSTTVVTAPSIAVVDGNELPAASSRPGVKLKLVSRPKPVLMPSHSSPKKSSKAPKKKDAPKAEKPVPQSGIAATTSSIFGTSKNLLTALSSTNKNTEIPTSAQESTMRSNRATTQLEIQQEFLRNYKDKIAIYRSQLSYQHQQQQQHNQHGGNLGNSAYTGTLTHQQPPPLKGPITVMSVTSKKTGPPRGSGLAGGRLTGHYSQFEEHQSRHHHHSHRHGSGKHHHKHSSPPAPAPLTSSAAQGGFRNEFRSDKGDYSRPRQHHQPRSRSRSRSYNEGENNGNRRYNKPGDGFKPQQRNNNTDYGSNSRPFTENNRGYGGGDRGNRGDQWSGRANNNNSGDRGGRGGGGGGARFKDERPRGHRDGDHVARAPPRVRTKSRSPRRDREPVPANAVDEPKVLAIPAVAAATATAPTVPKEKRREELLKQLKAVEDAIAKKKAKIDK